MKNMAAMETRLRSMEKMIAEIYMAVVATKRIDGVDELAYRRAIDQLAMGDVSALDAYMKRGGKIPVRDNGGGTMKEAAL
jgi:hypothetical protein